MTTKKDTPTPAVHWVDEYLVPLGACCASEYRQYPDAQTAWEQCENPHHLLWTLDETKVCNDRTFRLMACDFAEHVLHFFEEQYPTDNRPRDAIAAARAYAESPTEENRLKMAAARAATGDAGRYAAKVGVWAAAWAAGWAAARNATRIATKAAAWDAGKADAWADAWDTGKAAVSAAGKAAARAVGMDAENRWQCDCVRKYFPESPFAGAAIKKAKGKTE